MIDVQADLDKRRAGRIKTPATRHGACLTLGFVRANPHMVHDLKQIEPSSKHAAPIGRGGNLQVMQEGDLFWVADLAGNRLTKPTKGDFIAFGQAKELNNGVSLQRIGTTQPKGAAVQHTEKGENATKSQEEKDREAEAKAEQRSCRS